jgi:chalcone isomerase-like protein
MRKSLISLALVLFVSLSGIALNAASLAGVSLPDSQQVAGKNLVLNGLGLRTKMMVKVYIAGLYLEQKSSDPNAIMKSDSPKKIVMHFVHGASKNQMADAFNEGFSDNAPDAVKTMKADIDKLNGALDAINSGDEMVFTYVPGMGTTLSINGKDKVTIAGQPFEQALLSVWLGPKPPTADLKKGMLGQ